MMHRFDRAAELCAEAIRNSKDILLVSHIDADGLTSAAIMYRALERIGKSCEPMFVKKLDEKLLKDIAVRATGRTVVFTDLGSGALPIIKELGIKAVIADHHHVMPADYPLHMNPHLLGLNGSTEISGAGVAFLLAMKLGDNVDLSPLAIVGAVGDLQDMHSQALVGVNRQLLAIGVEHGYIACEKDLKLFGRQTRPIYKLLQYCSDPYLYGLTGSEDACIAFIESAGVPVKTNTWRRWIDLSQPEKMAITSKLFQHCMACGLEQDKFKRLIGEVYTLLKEQPGTETRDASEFSTLLNATARYEYADIGLAVCLGDRDEAFGQAKDLLEQHRRNLVAGLTLIEEKGMTRLDSLQYFNAGGQIRDTIVGIIAGMSFSLRCVSRDIPVIGFASAADGVKVSGRGNRDLVMKGLNLAHAIGEASSEVGGAGGGHDIAAGATIPAGKEDEFLAILDRKIAGQIRAR